MDGGSRIQWGKADLIYLISRTWVLIQGISRRLLDFPNRHCPTYSDRRALFRFGRNLSDNGPSNLTTPLDRQPSSSNFRWGGFSSGNGFGGRFSLAWCSLVFPVLLFLYASRRHEVSSPPSRSFLRTSRPLGNQRGRCLVPDRFFHPASAFRGGPDGHCRTKRRHQGLVARAIPRETR